MSNLPRLRAACQAILSRPPGVQPWAQVQPEARRLLTALPAALEVAEYAEHRPDCMGEKTDENGYPLCTCGLLEKLAALEAAGGGDG